jgi:hypothetical protein
MACVDWLYLYQTSEIVSFKIAQYCRMENQKVFFLDQYYFFSNEHNGKMDKIIFLKTNMMLEPKLYMNGHYIVPGTVFSSPGPLVQVNYCHHLASIVRRLLSVNFSHFKLLLRNHWADWNQT